jgi:hypothetical protein
VSVPHCIRLNDINSLAFLFSEKCECRNFVSSVPSRCHQALDQALDIAGNYLELTGQAFDKRGARVDRESSQGLQGAAANHS